MDSELEAIEVIKKYASINEKFVIQVKIIIMMNFGKLWISYCKKVILDFK